MAETGKYGKVEIPGIPEDEPVFILRGQDMVASTAIRAYAHNVKMVSTPDADFVRDVNGAADSMAAWQDANRHRVKLPD